MLRRPVRANRSNPRLAHRRPFAEALAEAAERFRQPAEAARVEVEPQGPVQAQVEPEEPAVALLRPQAEAVGARSRTPARVEPYSHPGIPRPQDYRGGTIVRPERGLAFCVRRNSAPCHWKAPIDMREGQ